MAPAGRICSFIVLTISMTVRCPAADAVFHRSRMFTLTDNEDAKIVLTLSDNSLAIQGFKAGGTRQEIPYTSIIRMRYESDSHHRYIQGIATSVVFGGSGAIVAATKAQIHWLAVDFNQDAGQSTAILRLDKKDFRDVTSGLAEKTGKPVELLDTKTDSLDPTMTSLNVEDTVAFPIEKVAAAVKHAMDRVGCKVQKESPSSIQCRRHHGNSVLAGAGGEIVTARLEAQGVGTHLRIVSKKVAARNRNWSTPIYEDME